MEQTSPIWRVAANILNKHSRTAERGGPPALILSKVLTTPQRKNWPVTKQINVSRTWADPLL